MPMARTQLAEQTPFQALGFAADNAADGIVEAINFSFYLIDAPRKVRVGQEMLVTTGAIEVTADGILDVEGIVSIERNPDPVVDPPAPIVYPENFSHRRIPSGESVDVPADQEMVLSQLIDVEGTLNLEGIRALVGVEEEVVFPPIPPPIVYPENFSFYRVLSSENVLIPENQEMVLADYCDVEGILDVEGRLAPIGRQTVYPENFSYDFVDQDVRVLVPHRQQMLVHWALTVEGELDIEGSVVLIN